MPRVIVDGIEYAPRADIPPPDNDKIMNALKELVSLYYFGDWHKAQGRVWDAICHISPELAELVYQNPTAAYECLHPRDKSEG